MFYMTYSDMNDYTSTPTSVVFSAPSLTPYDRYFPAYRIYTVDGNYPGSSFSVIDWEEWFFNLTLNNALPPSQAKWEQLYPSMLKEYGMDSAIPSEFHKLIERMKTDDDLYTKFYTGDLAIFICDTFKLEDNFICQAVITDFDDQVIWILDQIIVTPNQLCGLLIDGKPTMRVLHLTDIHLDMRYTPGLEADCDTSQCCRLQDIPDEVSADGAATQGIKRPAGYWGMWGKCDSPYWLFTNMLDHIVKTNGKLDYVVVTGDLAAHDVCAFPDIPVLFAIGNHEGLPVDMLTPHFAPSKWDEAWYYSWMMNAWKGAVPDDQSATMLYRGCYMTKLYPGLRVISLNNIFAGYMSMRQTPTILYNGCLISFWTLRKLATRCKLLRTSTEASFPLQNISLPRIFRRSSIA
ncbi:hypothetical protein WR25_10339 isoform C [Diploscapter pachys]|uniref:Calcineurin-like phosphoesterase domain-containing protein n=1 Tax=Diploscapter pachys TaxID=2018661 RepID=A0A2A2KW71_9BILA|nr:hypothetical protein WR25_10339 isoform B [Diploscapter pachys]PAV78236.1 hypothetical protein WR25_10339 isoform C [Diploscapter pachys]